MSFFIQLAWGQQIRDFTQQWEEKRAIELQRDALFGEMSDGEHFFVKEDFLTIEQMAFIQQWIVSGNSFRAHRMQEGECIQRYASNRGLVRIFEGKSPSDICHFEQCSLHDPDGRREIVEV